MSNASSIVAAAALQVSLEAKAGESFQTPRGCCVPFGVMDLAIAALPQQQQQRYQQLLEASETAGLDELNGIANELQVCSICVWGCGGGV